MKEVYVVVAKLLDERIEVSIYTTLKEAEKESAAIISANNDWTAIVKPMKLREKYDGKPA